MQIECPFCHARASLPDSKEGAKVRCGDCGRVYGARPVGRRAAKPTNPMPFVVGGIIIVVGAILWNVIQDGGRRPAPPPVVEAPEPEPDTGRGWNAPAVQAVAALHDAAARGDRTYLNNRLDGAAIAAQRSADEAAAAADAPAVPEGDAAAGTPAPDWDALEGFERKALLDGWIDELTAGEAPEAIGLWKAYDGRIDHQEGDRFVVLVDCRPVAGGPESKRFQWTVYPEGERWKVVAWGPWVDPDALASSRTARDRGYEKVTLSDGSRVYERQPEPLAHLEDTPQELRDEIEELYATIIDLDLTKEISRAKIRFTEIGRPAIPRLLTGLYEIPLETRDQARQIQNVVDTLRRITGQRFGYEPLVLVGSSMGTTEERRQSSIKQWFAWWYRKGEKFTEAEREDALKELVELTPKELEELELLEKLDKNKND